MVAITAIIGFRTGSWCCVRVMPPQYGTTAPGGRGPPKAANPRVDADLRAASLLPEQREEALAALH